MEDIRSGHDPLRSSVTERRLGVSGWCWLSRPGFVCRYVMISNGRMREMNSLDTYVCMM